MVKFFFVRSYNHKCWAPIKVEHANHYTNLPKGPRGHHTKKNQINAVCLWNVMQFMFHNFVFLFMFCSFAVMSCSLKREMGRKKNGHNDSNKSHQISNILLLNKWFKYLNHEMGSFCFFSLPLLKINRFQLLMCWRIHLSTQ